ncbi:uncharacterized protein LOC110009230 [Jatropha curcas]|uniref:uncharacterized protein LOC110009230 n=1 Tax=Jatropha curcas TaxID=180498 RepID=UPI001894B3E0|nr:uncharacterized protein LOC110009230 [Jatropha curcas]
MAKWVSVLIAYDLKFVQWKAVKGGALADQLAELPVEDQMPEMLEVEFPDEDLLSLESEVWEMYFNGASNYHGNGVGVTLVFGGFNLIVSQALRKWKIKEERLVPYLQRLDELAQQFEDLSFHYLPRAKNQFADALATLASMVNVGGDRVIRPLTVRLQKQPAHFMNLVDDKPWYWDIQNYLQNEVYPEGSTKTDQRTLRQLASGYFFTGGVLYKRSSNGLHLRCVDEGEAQTIMDSLHNGESGPHMHGIAGVRSTHARDSSVSKNYEPGLLLVDYDCRLREARAEVP